MQGTPHPFATASVPDGSEEAHMAYAFALFAWIGCCRARGNTFDWQSNIRFREAYEEVEVICSSRLSDEIL